MSDFFTRLADGDYLPTWYERMSSSTNTDDQNAAQRSEAHANTPTIAHFDALGRPFLTLADNGARGQYATRVELDIEGNQRSVIDALDRIVMTYDYDMLGNRIRQASMEAGEHWMLNDVAGKPIFGWDSRDHRLHTTYDVLRRPTEVNLQEGGGREQLVGKTVYGESQPDPEANNLRGKLYQAFDGAGVVTTPAYDFKGNLLHSNRQIAVDYKTTLDWSATVALEAEIFTTSTTYDALNRPVQLIAPHSDQPGARRNVIQPVYNAANLLEGVDVWLDHPSEPAALLDAAAVPTAAVGVRNIGYDAKGQRQRIAYKNGATTLYTYDPATFRLVQLLTQRDAVTFPDDCPQPPPANWPGCQVQNLHYTYDPAGNITHIRDDAQQTIYFRNRRVEPSADYTYDAIYQLIEATGREHIGQLSQPESTWSDEFRVNLPHPGDGQAMRLYTEQYEYDAVGNILQMIHQANNGNWTRGYAYHETSLIEDGKEGTPLRLSNRLSSTTVGANPVEHYEYDVHGSMTAMPHLPTMRWDFADQLSAVDLQGGGTAYYVYDGGGQRVRKVIERNGATVEERIYLGGYEVYRKRQSGVLQLERETLHVMDGQQRVAMVETRTQGNDSLAAQLIRYQFGNHLGSASLELDEAGAIISYEEYYPYGSTSYQAMDKRIKAAAKRYRYTGKERDEETGLYYHGARYYAPWLGRWTATDPGGMVDGPNLYIYVRNYPIGLRDPSGYESSHMENGVRKADGPPEELVVTGKKLGFWDTGLGKGLAFAGGVLTGLAVGVATAVVAGAVIAALPVSAGIGAVIGIGLGLAAIGYTAYEVHKNWEGLKKQTDRLWTGASALEWFGAGVALGGVLSIPFGGKTGAIGKAIGGVARELAFAEESAALNLTSTKVIPWLERGAENDVAYWARSWSERIWYDIGQKSLPEPLWREYGGIANPVERGWALFKGEGLLGVLRPYRSAWNKTWETGATPALRWAHQRAGQLLPWVIQGGSAASLSNAYKPYSGDRDLTSLYDFGVQMTAEIERGFWQWSEIPVEPF